MSDYPGALDTFTPPGSNLGTAGAEHSTLHQELMDAIEAIQAELGTNPAGTAATVAARMAAGGFPIPNNTVGAAQLEDGGVWPVNLQQNDIWNPLHAAWTSFDPSPSNVSTGVGGVVGKYKRVGSRCHVEVVFNFDDGSAIADTVTWFLPLTPVQTFVVGTVGFLNFPSGGGVAAPLGATTAYARNNTSQVFTIWTPNSSGHWDETGPITAGIIDDKQVVYSFTYEVAPSVGSLA